MDASYQGGSRSPLELLHQWRHGKDKREKRGEEIKK